VNRAVKGKYIVESAEEVQRGEVNLLTCSGPYWSAYMRGMVDGYTWALTNQAIEDERRWDQALADLAKTATRPSFAELSERRGESERAEIAREHERRMRTAMRAEPWQAA